MRRLEVLPPATKELLQLAAADPVGEPSVRGTPRRDWASIRGRRPRRSRPG